MYPGSGSDYSIQLSRPPLHQRPLCKMTLDLSYTTWTLMRTSKVCWCIDMLLPSSDNLHAELATTRLMIF